MAQDHPSFHEVSETTPKASKTSQQRRESTRYNLVSTARLCGNPPYQLEDDRPLVCPGIHSALPFTKDPKSISKTTYTTLSAEDVDNEVRRLFDAEFSERYSVGMEDCQNFCLRVCELICPDDEQSRMVRGHFYSKTFTRVLAATPHPRH
ncbi:MAG: hypothetical protein Q9191_003593 [Dirinaria sp. TL-2023a]